MQTIKNQNALADKIAELQNQQHSDLNLMKSHLDFTLESLNPINILKEQFSFSNKSPFQKSETIEEIVAIGTELFGNRLLFGGRFNHLNQILPNLIKKGVKVILTKNPAITEFSPKQFLKNILLKMKIKD